MRLPLVPTLLVLALSACTPSSESPRDAAGEPDVSSLPAYRVEVEICEGLGELASPVSEDGCYRHDLWIWGAPDRATLPEDFSPEVVLLSGAAIGWDAQPSYDVAVEGYGCVISATDEPDLSGFYYQPVHTYRVVFDESAAPSGDTIALDEIPGSSLTVERVEPGDFETIVSESLTSGAPCERATDERLASKFGASSWT